MNGKFCCALCQATAEQIGSGIVILGQYICASCESKIVRLTEDDPTYDVYKSGLKKIWRCKEA